MSENDRQVTELVRAVKSLLEWVKPIAGDNRDLHAAQLHEASVRRVENALNPFREPPQ